MWLREYLPTIRRNFLYPLRTPIIKNLANLQLTFTIIIWLRLDWKILKSVQLSMREITQSTHSMVRLPLVPNLIASRCIKLRRMRCCQLPIPTAQVKHIERNQSSTYTPTHRDSVKRTLRWSILESENIEFSPTSVSTILMIPWTRLVEQLWPR